MAIFYGETRKGAQRCAQTSVGAVPLLPSLASAISEGKTDRRPALNRVSIDAYLWDTHSRESAAWKHNGNWRVTATGAAGFTRNQVTLYITDLVEDQDIYVKNLTFMNTDTPDVLALEPLSNPNPTIGFDIEDFWPIGSTTADVNIYSIQTGSTTGYDFDDRTSPLAITNISIEKLTGTSYKVRYYLDLPPISSGVAVYGPDLALAVDPLVEGTSDLAGWHELTVNVPLLSEYWFVVSATDKSQDNKSHTQKPALERGVRVYEFTPPSNPVVTDDGTHTAINNQLHASWTASDAESGIARYEYAIGTAAYPNPGYNSVRDRTPVGLATEVTATGFTLSDPSPYYFSVKAVNGAGLEACGASDGITVDTSKSITIISSPASVAQYDKFEATFNISHTWIGTPW